MILSASCRCSCSWARTSCPQDDQSQYNVLVRTPEGTSLAATTDIAERIAQDIRKLPGVAHTLLTVGGGADKSVNNASIYVKLTRHRPAPVIAAAAHAAHARPAEEVSRRRFTPASSWSARVGGNQSNAEVQYFIQGPDLQKLAKYSDALLAKMKTMPGAGRRRHHAAQRQAGSAAGDRSRRAPPISASRVLDIEQALNTLVAGQVASTFNAGDDQYDVVVRAQEQFRGSVEGLAKMTVPSSQARLRRPGRGGRTSCPAPVPRRSTASTGSAR